MAIHFSDHSMRREALREYIEVAEYCIKYKKDKSDWGARGCYGYPAALLLLSIADSIGTDIMGGGDDTKKHFEVLNHKDYYDLGLKNGEIEILRNFYRNRLSHNAILEEGVALDIGDNSSSLLEEKQIITVGPKTICLNLVPFLNITKKAVSQYFEVISRKS